MLKRENDQFIYLITEQMNAIIDGRYSKTPCAEEIIPMIEAFFKKSIMVKSRRDKSNIICSLIEKMIEIVKYLAENTRNYEKLSTEDVSSLQKIFDELDTLYAEEIERISQSKNKENLSQKIDCIGQIICKNTVYMHDSEEKHDNYRDGMIFQNYENLWKIIHRLNSEWDELCSRGFSLRVFYDYWDSFKYDRTEGLEETEKEKMTTFMAVLDGKKKFVPIYEKRWVCFKVVDNDFDEEIVKTTIESKNYKSYRMQQNGEEAHEINSEE